MIARGSAAHYCEKDAPFGQESPLTFHIQIRDKAERLCQNSTPRRIKKRKILEFKMKPDEPTYVFTISRAGVQSEIKDGEMGYIEGAAREQVVLFPATLDDYIAPTSMVRAVGALVESLEVTALGFVRAEAKETGRPGYDPRMMLGIYVWGYLNKIRSSRQLERECGRNVELMWLTGNLQPDFKTIANFRKENTAALKGVLAQFWRWCLEEGLYGKEEVAIDGSKFEAVNANHRNYTREGVKKRLAALEAEAEKYLQEAAKADEAEEGGERKWTAEELKEKTRKLQERL